MARYSKYSEGELVDYIRRAILAGKYKPREHLVEKELSDYYHVSRTPIREALRQLDFPGLSGVGEMARDETCLHC